MLSLCLALLVAQPVAPPSVGEAEAANIRLALSWELANWLGRQHVDRCDQRCEEILGTHIRGVGRTVGEINLEFVPSPSGAIVDMVLTAVNRPIGHNVGTNGPVVLITDSETHLWARKRLFVRPDGVATLPAVANAQVTSHLKRIDTPYTGLLDRLIRNRALDTYRQNNEQGTAIARDRAIDRIRRQLDEDVDHRVAGWNRQLRELLREPLERRGIQPEWLHFLTDGGYFHVLGRLTDAKHPPTIGSPPGLPPGTHLGLWLHESLPNGQLTRLLAGKELTGAQIVQSVRAALGIPASSREGMPEGGSLSIRFPEAEPATLTFADDELKATIRTVAFTVGEDVYDTALARLQVIIRYRLVVEEERLVARRVGTVEVLPARYKKGDRIGAQQLSVIRSLERELADRFPEKPLDEKATFAAPSLMSGRVGTLRIEQVVASGGWLALGVRALPPVLQGPAPDPTMRKLDEHAGK